MAFSRIAAFMLLALSACPAPAPKPLPRLGDAHIAFEFDETKQTIRLLRDKTELMLISADAFVLGSVTAIDPTLSYDPYFLEYKDVFFQPNPPRDLRWRRSTGFKVQALDPAHAVVNISFDSGFAATWEVTLGNAGQFATRWTPITVPDGQQVALMRLRLRSDTSEAFYGLGEQLDVVNQRGTLRPMQMEPDLGIESSDTETHVPVPLLIGTHAWAVFVESRRLGLFDVGHKEADVTEITYSTAESSSDGLAVHFWVAEQPIDLFKPYYDLTGYPLMPAAWAYGPWLWRDENRDQGQFEDDLLQIRQRDLATSAVWIDFPYASEVNTFDFLPSQFPRPNDLVPKANEAGLRLALWHVPYVAAEPQHSEAVQKGYFPPTVGLVINPWSPPIDFTNPAAFSWWQTLLHRYTDLGFEGFKLDYAEDVAAGVSGGRSAWKFSDGSTERTMVDGYPRLYHRVYAEMLPSTGGWLLCRVSRWGDQTRASVLWPGDLDSTMTVYKEHFTAGGNDVTGVGGLPTAVVMMLSTSASGFPFFASDTGGYRHAPASKETFTRWFEQTALSAVMEVGDSSSEMPWEFNAANGRDTATLDLYRQFARLHLRLFPYVWSYAQDIKVTGHPIVRAVGLAYPASADHPSDEYLLGDSLLVAPVLSAGASSRSVLFPKGRWYDWFTGELTEVTDDPGLRQQVDAPLEKLPLYLAAGAIVPMLRPTIDTLSPTTLSVDQVDSYANHAGILYLRLAPPTGQHQFGLFDGTHWELDVQSDGFSLVMQQGTQFTEGQILEAIHTATPQSVTIDAQPIAAVGSLAALETSTGGWFWEAATGGTLWVRVPAGSHAVVVH